jgi:hypothetical protein
VTHRLRRASIVLAGTAALTAGLIGGGASADTASPLISGHVLRADGSPLANAVVRFGRFSARSGTDGSYYLGISSAEPTGRLEVQNPGAFTQPTGMPTQFEMRWQSVTITEDTVIDFTVPPVVEQTFVVENSSGEPVLGYIRPQQPDILDQADSAGSGTGLPEPTISQQIDQVESGETTLVFPDRRLVGLEVSGFPGISTDASNSYLTQDVDALDVGHDEPAVATLPPTGSLAVVIEDFDGQPVSDVAIYLKSRHGFTQGRTDANGIFRGTAERGEWPVNLWAGAAPGTRPQWTTEFSRTVFDRSRWEYRLPNTQLVPVKVHYGDGSPAAGAIVRAKVDEVPADAWGAEPTLGVTQTLEAETDDRGLARVPAFVDPLEVSGLPRFSATASRLGSVDRWTLRETFTVDDPKERTAVSLPSTTRLHGPVIDPDQGFFVNQLRSSGPGVSGATRVDDNYRITAAAKGGVLSIVRQSFDAYARVPIGFRVAVPFSSRQSRVRAAYTPPEVHRLVVRFEHRDGEPARGHLWIASAVAERADRAEVFRGMPEATVRQTLRGESFGTGGARLWFFADHDVERLNVYRADDDGNSAVVAVVRHLRLLDNRTITVVVGSAEDPVIQ